MEMLYNSLSPHRHHNTVLAQYLGHKTFYHNVVICQVLQCGSFLLFFSNPKHLTNKHCHKLFVPVYMVWMNRKKTFFMSSFILHWAGWGAGIGLCCSGNQDKQPNQISSTEHVQQFLAWRNSNRCWSTCVQHEMETSELKALQPVSWSNAAVSAGSVYIWLGVQLGLWLSSGRVNATWKKNASWSTRRFFSQDSRCVCGIPGVENIPAIHFLTGHSLQLVLSFFHTHVLSYFSLICMWNQVLIPFWSCSALCQPGGTVGLRAWEAATNLSLRVYLLYASIHELRHQGKGTCVLKWVAVDRCSVELH